VVRSHEGRELCTTAITVAEILLALSGSLGGAARKYCGRLPRRSSKPVEDREDSRLASRSLNASTRAQSRIAAVWPGVVELWLSQGTPKDGQEWGFAALIWPPSQAFAENAGQRAGARRGSGFRLDEPD